MNWQEVDGDVLRRAGVKDPACDRLATKGLPVDAHRWFVLRPERLLGRRDLPGAGPCVYLGDFEDGVNSYWLRLEDSSVWMLRGYDDGPQEVGFVNSSVKVFQTFLERWVRFLECGASDEDDDYEELVEGMIEYFSKWDPPAFEEEDLWWARVFEEVELGVLAPE